MKIVIYLLCTLAILVQLPTAADIFLGTYGMSYFGAGIRYFQAFGYATVFEVSILIFVIQRRLWYAGVFAFFSLLTNLISHDVWPWLTSSAPLLISIQLPLAIAIYSHELERLRTAALCKQAEPEPVPDAVRPKRKPAPAPSYPPVEYAFAKSPETLKTVLFAENTPASGNGHHAYGSDILPDSNTLRELTEPGPQTDTMEPNRICECCQTPFYSTIITQRFCKNSCRSKYNRDIKKINDEKETE